MTEKFTCPRRHENSMASSTSPFVGAGTGRDSYTAKHGMVGQDRGCSYCGSLPPDEFMDAVRNGEEIGPTDKSYKFYVSKGMRAKFYTQHLSIEQGDEFIRLWDERQINWGYPGYPYVRLYIPHTIE